MRDHPIAAVIGLLMVAFHLAAMTMGLWEDLDGRPDDPLEAPGSEYDW